MSSHIIRWHHNRDQVEAISLPITKEEVQLKAVKDEAARIWAKWMEPTSIWFCGIWKCHN